MPRIYPALALAGRLHMPALRVDRQAVGDVARVAALPWLPGADVADGRDNVSGHPQAVANVVHGDVVRHQPKERRQRSGLQRVLGLSSYETAWTWLHKLRRAMVRPGRDLLCGTVEVDETYVGGAEKGKRGRETETKAIVAVAAEENGKGIGRIRLRRVKDVSGASLLPFVQSAAVPGAVIHTDGWSGYSGLTAAGYKHEVTVVSASPDPAPVTMPRVHNIAALLKRWLLGTHQGGVQHVHLDYYLDEFAFRFNRRRSKARGLLFHRLASQAVAIGPATYDAIVANAESGHPSAQLE